jgi:hypothetical protein
VGKQWRLDNNTLLINEINTCVGPSRANLRKDGKLGGMVVEKCKFLQVKKLLYPMSSVSGTYTSYFTA